MAKWGVRLLCVGIFIGCLNVISANYQPLHAQEIVLHTIRYGESLSTIARQYGVSVGVITSSNGIVNPNLVRSGQKLRIPVASRSAVGNPPASPDTDTPPSLNATQQPHAHVPVIVPTPNTPQIIPTPYPTLTPAPPVKVTRFYTVRPNDTLYGIAMRFGVSVAAIKACNRLYGSAIFVGQLLAIP